jgi:hypothetical protein
MKEKNLKEKDHFWKCISSKDNLIPPLEDQ